MNTSNRYDVIVIGVGSMGSAACWFLADRGHKVLGIEQFDIVHENGSHFGQSRIIRKAYFEHPDYVPLLERAYENWNAFEKKTDSKLFERTGILYMGRPENENIKGILRSASLYQIPVSEVPRQQVQEKFPFRIPVDFKSIFEPDAGFVTPERTIRLYAGEAGKSGAVFKTNESVVGWKEVAGKVEVNTTRDRYTCDKLIFTSGAWTSKLIPRLPATLEITKQMLAWVKPKKIETFALGNFPCWFVEDPDLGTFYGFPVLPQNKFGDPVGLKLARHFPGEVADPDSTDRSTPHVFEREIRNFLQAYIPDADGSLIAAKSCLYTYSSDEHFIIDHLPGYSNRVTIACGFSGHGFKFVPVIGEILADLAVKGKTALPVEFLKLDRLKERE
jgi:sarcosine oxidase